MTDVRVRIAPSPTGNLHVGTARTALFNWLFARRHGGRFILRVEDTDTQRSEAQYTQNIFDSLHALGIAWDEGPDVGGPCAPYTQMERLADYQRFASALLDAGLAYYSYETEAELEAQRDAAKAAGRAYAYRRPSSEVLAAHRADPTRTATLRLAVPTDRGEIIVHDAIRGDVSFDSALIGDFVLMKSSGSPTYNFAVVVDDVLMGITHIIRGEDHLSNTPRQVLLYEAFERLGLCSSALPVFAHVGMILAPDRSKLSKRHGATAVSDYIQQGYLPEAFCNFLSLLGWSPPDGQEIGTLEHFASIFDLSRIAHSPAVFERDKLDWLNRHYMRELPIEDFLTRARPYLQDYDLSEYTHEQLALMLDAVREPLTTLAEVRDAVSYFFGPGVMLDAQVVGETLMSDEALAVLRAFDAQLVSQADFTSPQALSDALKALIQSLKPLKAKAVLWPIRAALTGRVHGADLGKTLFLLGREKVSLRLHSAFRLLGHPVAGSRAE